MQKKLISRIEFSRQAGVSRMAITKACKNKLQPTLSGKMIDLDHPASIEYLKRHKKVGVYKPPIKKIIKKKSNKPSVSSSTKSIDPKESVYSKDLELEEVKDLTVSQLILNFGTDERFKVWISGFKMVEEIRYKRLIIEEKSKTLIPRDLVKEKIFGALTDYNLKILTDATRAISSRLISLGKSGGTVEEGEAVTRDILSRQLRSIKTSIKRSIKNA